MPWSKVDGSEVDACSDDEVAVVKDEDGTVEGCHATEDDANEQLAALNASEEGRADAGDLSSGDLVTWGPSNARRYGEVASVEMSGTHEPEGVDGGPSMEASEDNPVIRIQHYEQQDGEWTQTDVLTVHRAESLEQIDSFPERSIRHMQGSYRAVLPGTNIRQTAEENRVTVQFMTEEVARDGMVLDADGLDTSAFEQNPVVLWSHGTDPRRGDEPIARASNIRRNGDGMLADVTFAEDEFAQRIKRKVEDGFVNAVSVGWRTEDIDQSGDAPTVTRSDMTEFSFVAVPADTQALVQERTAGSEVEGKINELKREIDKLKSERAPATATSPCSDTDTEGTPSESVDEDRDDAQERTRYVPLSQLRKLKQERKQEVRETIRTELKKALGMA